MPKRVTTREPVTEERTAAQAPAEAAVRIVSHFEASLLRMLRSFLRPQSGELSPAPVPVAAGKLAMPAGLSDNCLYLIQDSLGKGCVQYLARAGGWRRERFLRAGQPVDGRLWERSAAADLGLTFSAHSIRFLMWLTAGRPIDATNNWEPDLASLTAADQFLLFLVYEGLRDVDGAAMQSLRMNAAFFRNGLVRLFFPEDFSGAAEQSPDFAVWTVGPGAMILEALHPRLRDRWLELERNKINITEWDRLRSIGRSQDQTLTAFLTACENTRRPDLARFLLKALAELLSRDLTPAFWIGGLTAASAPTKLADRLDTQRQALTLLRHVEHIAGWARQYSGTTFFDDDYAVAQLFLSDWEHDRGRDITAIAQHLLRQLEPLRVSSSGKSGLAANTRGLESGTN